MGIKTIHCKFCGKEDKNYAGYCQKCYNYFCVSGYKTYSAEYGKICKVDDINDKQYEMIKKDLKKVKKRSCICNSFREIDYFIFVLSVLDQLE